MLVGEQFPMRPLRDDFRYEQERVEVDPFVLVTERERERYFSVVTGTHYGTKIPPGQLASSLPDHAQGI